jgi:hypothetical protein
MDERKHDDGSHKAAFLLPMARRGTKGPSNRYGNDRGEPSKHINYDYARGFRQDTLDRHVENHHSILGIGKDDVNEYEARAVAFANKVDTLLYDSFVDERGRTFKFSFETNEFVITRNDGMIVTYYIINEKDPKAYWERKKKEHGK